MFKDTSISSLIPRPVPFLVAHMKELLCVQPKTVWALAPFPGSSPAFCRILYSMRQKAGEEPGNEASGPGNEAKQLHIHAVVHELLKAAKERSTAYVIYTDLEKQIILLDTNCKLLVHAMEKVWPSQQADMQDLTNVVNSLSLVG